MLEILSPLTNTWLPASLPSTTSISIEVVGKIMNQEYGGSYSYPFTLDVEANEHIFGSSAELYGDSLFKVLHGCPARYSLNGQIIIQGKLVLEDTAEVKHSTTHKIEVKIVNANKEFDKIIEGVKVRDLQVLEDNIQIGYCLPKNVPFTAPYTRTRHGWTTFYDAHTGNPYMDWDKLDSEHFLGDGNFALPQYFVPNYKDPDHPEYTRNFTNVHEPYNPLAPTLHPYCNVRACYQKFVAEEDKTKSDGDWNKERGYSIGQPDRVNSAPCFYLGYVFDKAMHDLKVPITYNALNDIMDYRRMAFWHTDPHYEAVKIEQNGIRFHNSVSANGIEVSAKYMSGQQYNGGYEFIGEDGKKYKYTYQFDDDVRKDGNINPGFTLHAAIATADNLPDIEVKELCEDIKSAFNARIIYDEALRSISVVLIKDVMQAYNNPYVVPCEVQDINKVENNIKGVRLKYADAATISANTVTKVKNETQGSDSTSFNYNGFSDVEVLGSGNAPVSYLDLLRTASCWDTSLYVDPVTDNTYRIKVDGQADQQMTWFPSLIEVAGYHDVEIGDCSDKDTTKELTISFAPVISSMTNHREILQSLNNGKGVLSPIYAQFIDGEIYHNDDNTPIEHKYGYNGLVLEQMLDKESRVVTSLHIDIELTVKSIEDYEAGSDDGPYFANECQNTIGIMRGSGSGTSVTIFDQDYDGFGTSQYLLTAGSDAEFFSDSVNHFGELFDYNGGGRTLVSPDMAKVYLRSYFSSAKGDFSMLFISDIVSSTSTRKNNTTGKYELCFYYSGTNETIVVNAYDTEEDANAFRQVLIDLYTIRITGTEGYVTFPDNGLGYVLDDIVSLKLQATKPELSAYNGTGSSVFANRGLFTKYYSPWMYFLLEHRIASFNTILNPSTFHELAQDTTRWYTFGPLTGLIDRITATPTPQGDLLCQVSLAYK